MEENEIKNEIKLEEKEEIKKLKVIISGNKGVGKTSIKSIIFNNMEPKETLNLASSEEIQEAHINYINNINIDVLELSSNPDEIKQYFSTKKEYIFSNVTIFIFVTNAQEQKNDDLKFFEE
jgi:Ras-related GTP-binding protein A/B